MWCLRVGFCTQAVITHTLLDLVLENRKAKRDQHHAPLHWKEFKNKKIPGSTEMTLE